MTITVVIMAMAPRLAMTARTGEDDASHDSVPTFTDKCCQVSHLWGQRAAALFITFGDLDHETRLYFWNMKQDFIFRT